MKKNIIIAASLLLLAGATAFAQENRKEDKKMSPEQKLEMKANRMAGKLLLSDEETAKFTPVFKEYIKSDRAIKAKYRPEDRKKANLSNSEIDASIRKEFKKSQEILDLRVEYYEKFSKVLSARQIREMYKIEQEDLHGAQYRHYMNKGPQHGFGKSPRNCPQNCPENKAEK